MSTDERHLNNRVRRLSEIWQLYIKLGSFPQADRWLKQYAREARFGKKDRQFYSDHFFGLFRVFNRFAAATFMARENVTTEGDLARCCFIPQQEWVNLLQEPSCSWFVPVQVGLEALPSPLSHSFDRLSAWRTAHPI